MNTDATDASDTAAARLLPPTGQAIATVHAAAIRREFSAALHDGAFRPCTAPEAPAFGDRSAVDELGRELGAVFVGVADEDRPDLPLFVFQGADGALVVVIDSALVGGEGDGTYVVLA